MGKSSKKTTVGYTYYWDMQAGLGRGPINEIVAITSDKKNVFAGVAGQVSDNMTLHINKPNLFGGEDVGGEGGIKGDLDIMMGARDQVPTNKLLNALKNLVPGFRGLVTTFFSGKISSFSASPKPWLYRVRRTTKGWDGDVWYPEKCTIVLRDDVSEISDFKDEADAVYGFIDEPYRYHNTTDAEWAKILAKHQIALLELNKKKEALQEKIIDNIRTINAMNAAHILVECATNGQWGRGLCFDDINLDSYKLAADKLYDEKFGLCFRYNRQSDLNTFIQQILDHIGAAQYGDLSTGKLTLKLIRDDYDPKTLPLFTLDTGILSVQDDDSAGVDSAPNEIIGTYHNPVTNMDCEVRAQNLGAIQSVGLISSNIEYKAIPTRSLAERVIQRDLEMSAAGVKRFVLKFDRRGGELMPASVFRLSLPDREIDNMIMRVGSIEENEDGSFTISAVQDIFGLPQSSYNAGSEQGSQWTPPDKTVHIVNDAQLIELPYSILAGALSAADLDYLNAESSYLGVMATAPTTLSINYQLLTRPQGNEFINHGIADWTATGTLPQSIDALATSIYIDSEYVPAIGEGIIIDDEILRIEAIDMSTGIVTVGRGCVDTLPAYHKAGACVRFYMTGLEMDNVEYLNSETVNAKLLTTTSAGTLDAALAPTLKIQMQGRQNRPYLPGNIRINDVLYPQLVALSDNYQLTFSHRDRLLQADQLIDCFADSIGPETGSNYLIQILDKDNVIWSIETTESTIDLPYDTSESDENATHTLVLKTQRNGTYSLNTFTTTLPVGRLITDESEVTP